MSKKNQNPLWISEYTRLLFRDYDCWQLICKIYRDQFGIMLPTYKLDYKSPTDMNRIQDLCEARKTNMWEEIGEPKVGDCILFEIRKIPCHIGMCINPSRHLMIHSMRKINVVIEDFSLPRWFYRTKGFFHYVGR